MSMQHDAQEGIIGAKSQAVGENVAVKPVLALTGWFVECTKNDLTIYNGKNPSSINGEFAYTLYDSKNRPSA